MRPPRVLAQPGRPLIVAKMSPRRPQMARRRPKTGQNATKIAQKASKRAQDGLQDGEDGPKWISRQPILAFNMSSSSTSSFSFLLLLPLSLLPFLPFERTGYDKNDDVNLINKAKCMRRGTRGSSWGGGRGGRSKEEENFCGGREESKNVPRQPTGANIPP